MTVCERTILKASFNKANRRMSTVDLRRAKFGFLRDTLERILSDMVLKKRVQKIFFQAFLTPSSRTVLPHIQETKQKWQKACMNEK